MLDQLKQPATSMKGRNKPELGGKSSDKNLQNPSRQLDFETEKHARNSPPGNRLPPMENAFDKEGTAVRFGGTEEEKGGVMEMQNQVVKKKGESTETGKKNLRDTQPFDQLENNVGKTKKGVVQKGSDSDFDDLSSVDLN